MTDDKRLPPFPKTKEGVERILAAAHELALAEEEDDQAMTDDKRSELQQWAEKARRSRTDPLGSDYLGRIEGARWLLERLKSEYDLVYEHGSGEWRGANSVLRLARELCGEG